MTLTWCGQCLASVSHEMHPEFAVRGQVEARTDFSVDLVALIKAWPEDWARICEEESDLEEAVNTLICGTLVEGEEWGPVWAPRGFIHLRSDEPELEWSVPRVEHDSFFTRLEEALVALKLWGVDPEELAPVNSPGQLAIDIEETDGSFDEPSRSL